MNLENNTSKLSKREKEVLELISKEFTTSEISENLGISFGTVQSHRKNIREKFQAKNIAGVIVKAIKSGELEITEM